MKKYILLIFIVAFISCKEEEKPYMMYGFLQEQLHLSSNILRDQISETIANHNLTDESIVKEYDSLTKEYLLYLEKTHSELTSHINGVQATISVGELSEIKHGNNYFFEGENYSKKGAEYIYKMENYRTVILDLVDNENLRNRINLTLSTSDIINRDADTIKYLNWFYRDMPLISILTHLKHQEKTILEIENDFLKNKLIYN